MKFSSCKVGQRVKVKDEVPWKGAITHVSDITGCASVISDNGLYEVRAPQKLIKLVPKKKVAAREFWVGRDPNGVEAYRAYEFNEKFITGEKPPRLWSDNDIDPGLKWEWIRVREIK